MADSRRRTPRKEENPNIEQLTGNQPPQAIEVEEAVLGALLVDPNCLDDVMDDLTDPDCFYDARNKEIFGTIRTLFNQHCPVDLVTVVERLASDGKLAVVGGAERIAELSSRVGAAAHVEYYCKVLKEKYLQRSLITASYKILKESFKEGVNVENLADMAQTEVYKATELKESAEAQNISGLINKVMTDLERLQNQESRYSGVPSGFPTLDDITLGWQASDLIILAARPSVGKTAFALNVARNAAIQHYPVAIFSLEMPASQLVKRMMVSETGIDSKKLKGGSKLTPDDWKRLEAKLHDLAQAPIYIDDTPSLPVMEFRSKVKKLVKQKGVRLILVDYLQLMQGPVELRGMREQEVAAISRTLKATAKEHNVPIIALSQLSRQAVTRQGTNNRPQLSDLRESGSIEQDADMVLFIHRLDYQGLSGEDVQQGETKLIIAKHRNGEIADVDLVFKASEAKFIDASEEAVAGSFLNQSDVVEYQSRMNSAADDGFYPDDGFGSF